jgi:hypothetical protein
MLLLTPPVPKPAVQHSWTPRFISPNHHTASKPHHHLPTWYSPPSSFSTTSSNDPIPRTACNEQPAFLILYSSISNKRSLKYSPSPGYFRIVQIVLFISTTYWNLINQFFFFFFQCGEKPPPSPKNACEERWRGGGGKGTRGRRIWYWNWTGRWDRFVFKGKENV